MISSRMLTSDDVDKQITEENSTSTSSSNPLLVSPLVTASKTPEENYKISLAIFKNLDAAAQNKKFGSQRSKRNSEFYDPSLSSSLHDVPPILKSCPSLGQSLRSTGKYYLRQSLYGTVRMNPLKSFPTVFNSKSLTGVASLKLEENESADSFEDEGNPESPGAASLNFFHGNYHQIKDNPSYLSDNEEEDDGNLEHVSTQEDLKSTSTRFNDPASDGISLTSDYDSVSTGSTSTTCNATECTISTKKGTNQFSNQPIETSNQSDKVIESDNPINSCRFTDSNNRSNNNNNSNNNVVETNNKTSLQAKLSKFELNAESKNVDNNHSVKIPAVSDEKFSSHRSDDIDQKSSANFVSLPATLSDKISPTFKKPDRTSNPNSITACPTSKGTTLDPGSEVTTSEKGEVRVRERETLTTIRLRARSSTICKRREKLKSKAEDVAEEFRQKSENSQGHPGGKLDEVRKTLENLNLSQTNLSNISTLVRSKSHLAGIQQNIKVERTEKEIHFIQQLDPTILCNNSDTANSSNNNNNDSAHSSNNNNTSTNNNTIINNSSNNNNIILMTTQPTTGSVTKEFSEIFLDVEKFQVEINNIVCCETILLKPTFPQTSDGSTSERSNGKCMTDQSTTVIPSGRHPTFEASSLPSPSSSSSPPPSSSPSSSPNIFKVTSVLLIRTTIIDMNTTPERKRIFREMNEEFAKDGKDNHHHYHHHHRHHHHQSSKGDQVQVILQDGESNPGDDRGQVEKKKLSEKEFSVFCCKMKELSALETFLV